MERNRYAIIISNKDTGEAIKFAVMYATCEKSVIKKLKCFKNCSFNIVELEDGEDKIIKVGN